MEPEDVFSRKVAAKPVAHIQQKITGAVLLYLAKMLNAVYQ